MNDLQAARALGYASVGIAAAEVSGQGAVERDLLGIDEQPELMHALGAREAASGAVILSQHRITPTLAAGLWSRVAGDAIDLALLGLAAPRSRRPGGLAAATLMVAGITVLDLICAVRIQRRLAIAKDYARAARPAMAKRPAQVAAR